MIERDQLLKEIFELRKEERKIWELINEKVSLEKKLVSKKGKTIIVISPEQQRQTLEDITDLVCKHDPKIMRPYG